MQERIASKRAELKEVEKELKDEKGKKRKDASGIDKLQAKVDRLKSQLSKQKTQVRIKEDNKTVALGTSKMNYMDPRISVVFCKRAGLEIHKVFTKLHLEKFPWAMYTQTTWRF